MGKLAVPSNVKIRGDLWHDCGIKQVSWYQHLATPESKESSSWLIGKGFWIWLIPENCQSKLYGLLVFVYLKISKVSGSWEEIL